MFQYFFFCLILALSILDIFFFQTHSTLIFLFYVLLKIQADIAANEFVLKRIGLIKTEKKPEEDYFAQIKIPKNLIEDTAEPAHKKEPSNVLSFKKTIPLTPKIPPKTKPFELPKFQGKPHEVLGIEEYAITKVIQKAFRHWIKHYHPDHQQPTLKHKATAQARKLQEAKENMLAQRAKSRIAKAA